jgi:hypothetical protein
MRRAILARIRVGGVLEALTEEELHRGRGVGLEVFHESEIEFVVPDDH